MRSLALLWLLSGCNECVDGESRCFGDGLAVCDYGQWAISSCCSQDGCREVEADGDQIAVCTPSNAPDPRCEGAAPIDNICVGGTRLHCDSGYGGAERACDVTCVSPEPGTAFCALSDQPDPRCPPTGFGRRCARDRILSCLDGFLTSEELCPAEFPECATSPNNLGGLEPTCATLPTLECAADSPSRCAGLDIFGCHGGRKTFAHCAVSCYENPIDSMFPEAFCESADCDYD